MTQTPTSLKKLSGLFCHGLGTLNLSVYGPSHSAPLVKEKIKLMAARTQVAGAANHISKRQQINQQATTLCFASVGNNRIARYST